MWEFPSPASLRGNAVRLTGPYGDKTSLDNQVPSQFSSVAQLCLTLWDPMDCSKPGLPVHHQLLELTQTHVHRVGDAIQPSHPLLSPLLLPSIFASIRVFFSESFLCIRWPKYWEFQFQHQSFQ